MSLTLTFDAEETLLRGQIPLHVFKTQIEKWNEGSVIKIIVPRNGFFNDAVLHYMYSKKKKNYTAIYEINLEGCVQITNAGIYWLTQILSTCKSYKMKITLDGNNQLSDDDLALLFKLNFEYIYMKGASIRHLSHPICVGNSTVETNGCPVLTGKEVLVDMKYSHVLIVHQRSMPCCSMIEFMQSKKETSLNSFKHVTGFQLNDWNLTLSEVHLYHPLFNLMTSSHPVQVIIPFHADKGTVDEISKHILETILSVVSKAAFTTDYPKNQELPKEVVTPAENADNSAKNEQEGNTKVEAEKKPEAEKKEEEKKPEVIREFRECEFILVQIGNKPDQLEKLQEKMKGDIFKETIESINKNMEHHEEHLEDLDTVGQSVYSTLGTTKAKLERFIAARENRLHYLSLDIKSKMGLEKLQDKMTEILNCRKHHQEVRYKIHERFLKALEVVMETVKKEGIIDLSSGLKEKLDINGNEFSQIAKLLQEQGRLIIFNLCGKTIAVDVTYLKSVYEKLISGGMNYTKALTPALQKCDKIFTVDSVTKLLELKDDEKSDLIMKIIQDYFGLIELPVLREAPTDQQFIYTFLTKIKDNASVSLETYYTKDRRPNFMTLERTYRFICPVSDNVFAGILSSASKYSRTLLMSTHGAVYQIGCVQTVMKTCQDYTTVTIQSKCYLPDNKTDVVDEIYVKEYTWNIFCIYTDLTDKILKQHNMAYERTGEIPKGFVNNSIGCKHVWKSIDSKYIQSVCTLCNKCCNQGRKCQYNGILGDHLRECMCKTSSPGCVDCGICIDCAEELWEIRSYLRPQAQCANYSSRNSSSYPESVLSLAPLDSYAFNEAEFQLTKATGSLGVYLKEVEDGSVISLFPGKATAISSADVLSDGTIVQKMKELIKDVDPLYLLQHFDNLKIRITDPFRVTTKQVAEELDLSSLKESRVVYHSYFCRMLRVSHETGLLCFDANVTTNPVGQFLGQQKFSEKLRKFSIKIVNEGEKRMIGIGVAHKDYAPNRMVGWDGMSYGYHADDGKAFVTSGTGRPVNCKYYKDDVVSVYCDPDKLDIRFYRNETLVYTVPPEEIKLPRYGFYPMVCMHSPGECVKLLEKDVWSRDPTTSPSKPAAFDTYKYGNMWISPRKTLKLTKKDSTNYFSGWIILCNPTKSLIGFQMSPTTITNYVGTLTPNESRPIFVRRTEQEKEEIVVEWIVIDQVKSYKTDEIQKLFQAAPENRKYNHRLSMVMSGTALSLETLPLFSDAGGMDGYKLDILKNSTLVNSYLLKRGRYLLDFVKIEGYEPTFLLKRPKCPSFLYPPILQRRMKIVTSLKQNESEIGKMVMTLVSKVSETGTFDYTFNEEGFDELVEKKCLQLTDQEWKEFEKQLKEKPDEAIVQLNEDDNNLIQRTHIPAPPYLVTKSSFLAYKYIEPDWKKNILYKFSSCSHVITRPTVQEQNITVQSRTLLKWIRQQPSSKIPHAMVYLPSNLDSTKLMYPVATNMFDDVNVHKLCFLHDDLVGWDSFIEGVDKSQTVSYPTVKVQLDDAPSVAIHDGESERVYPLVTPQEVSIHFMDLPGFPLKKHFSVEGSYADFFQAWNYVALLSQKLMLPVYDKIFSGGLSKDSQVPRPQVESLMFHLLQSYAALCGLYATQHGGLSFQVPRYDFHTQDLYKEDLPTVPVNSGMTLDDHSLISCRHMMACKAHAHAHADKINIPKFSLESKYFKPFSPFTDILMIRKQELRALPSDLSTTFSNVRIMTIVDIDLKDTSMFPAGISTCKHLEVLCLSGLKGIKSMPKDIISGPALTTFYLHNCPVNKLDIDWPESKTLTSLTLKGLLVENIPAGIGRLKELLELNLDYNPITTLPDEIESMTKLKHLSLKGIPWISLQGKYDQMTKAMYDTWHEEKPFIVNYLSKKEVDNLFHLCDTNSNDVLEKAEVAKLNVHFLFKIPHLGNQLSGKSEYGGIPPVIFKLTSLETIDLSYTAITHLPAATREISSLEVINLAHCPLLTSIDGNVGLLPNLRSLQLNSCALLDTPPQDIIGRGFEAVKSFLQTMAGGFTECHRTKLMFIGLGQAGKTTLLKALQSSGKKYTGSIPKLTDGIEIKDWMVPVNQDGKQFQIRFSCWDFAGQTVYYNTHQFFLSKQAVYMLLWNMRMGFEHAGLDFWLSSIACHCPDSPVIVVGTQLDQIPMPDIREDELMKKYPQIKKFCYVSSTVGTNVQELENTLIDVTLNYCPQMKMNIPLLWLKLEDSIMNARNKFKQNIIDWNVIVQFANEHGLSDDRDIKLAVQFLDDLGIVQYFDTEVLKDKVVINPQWIVDVMAKVVSVNEKSIRESCGKFYHKYIPTIWKNYDDNLHGWMLKLTEAFDLTFPIPEDEEKINIVPCLLPEKEPKNLPWPYLKEEDGIRESMIRYKFTYLPTGLFNRAQARLFSQGFMISNEFLDLMWKRGTILKKNDHYALVKQTSDDEMVVTVQGVRPKNILDLIHETLSTLIKDSFQGVNYDFYIPCPDCLEKKGTRDPYLFKAGLITRAHSVNAPFLQCTKYFHTVSIGELMNNLPDNNEAEFDNQMQQSISTLQEISSNMAKDVAILYCPGDIPTAVNENKMVDPRQICKDLKNAGFKCWMPANTDTTPELEMTMEIKNSKVLVVCMSAKFVRHPKCHHMFLYAAEQLKKSFAIAVIDETLDFQQTDLGFKIGIPKMAVIKNVERYPKKILDLVDIVRSFIQDAEKKLIGHPPVFISYCWTNSKEACAETTQAKEGSLGFGDPRALKKHLDKNGIKCWLDIEQIGNLGLYQHITVGLQNAKVLVLCVSDEYLQSEACMTEARFGVYNLMMPVVVCVVGTGKAWETSEVSLMISKQGDLATIVNLQKKGNGTYDQVMECVRNFLERPDTDKRRKIQEKLARDQAKEEQMKKEKEKEEEMGQQGDNKFSFQEEIELIQRKFLRHVSKVTKLDDLANKHPNLLVFDFVGAENDVTEAQQILEEMGSRADLSEQSSSVVTSSVTQNPPKIQRSKSTLGKPIKKHVEGDEWKEMKFCIRLLCEDEQGWHLEGNPLSLSNFGQEEILKALKDMSPYLARIYAVLRQSAITLNCFASPQGDKFTNYIKQEGIGIKNFRDSYQLIHKIVAEHQEHDEFVKQLNRCYHQTGKISWLCSTHQNKAGITLLPAGTSRIHGSAHIQLFDEDILLSEFLQESNAYLAWKGDGSQHTPNHQNKKQLPKSANDQKKNDVQKNGDKEIVKKEPVKEVPKVQEKQDKTLQPEPKETVKPAEKKVEVSNNQQPAKTATQVNEPAKITSPQTTTSGSNQQPAKTTTQINEPAKVTTPQTTPSGSNQQPAKTATQVNEPAKVTTPQTTPSGSNQQPVNTTTQVNQAAKITTPQTTSGGNNQQTGTTSAQEKEAAKSSTPQQSMNDKDDRQDLSKSQHGTNTPQTKPQSNVKGSSTCSVM